MQGSTFRKSDQCILSSNLCPIFFSVPPTITPFQWLPTPEGHRTSATCQIPTGDLPIRITWYWNGKIIKNNHNGVSISNRTFLSHLEFSDVKTEHRGRYTCKAENRAGSASYSTELIVQGLSFVAFVMACVF